MMKSQPIIHLRLYFIKSNLLVNFWASLIKASLVLIFLSTSFFANAQYQYDVSKAIYSGNGERFFLGTQEDDPHDIAFNSTGTKMFIIGLNEYVYEYTLATAFDVSTASYAGDAERLNLTALSSTRDLHFNPAGNKLFILDYSGDEIYQYNLSTAFDVSTATLAGQFDTGPTNAYPFAMDFSVAGDRMYLIDFLNEDILQYSLSTPFDVTTATYTKRKSIGAQEVLPYSLEFKPDGSKMYLLGQDKKAILEYSLSTPYDIATATYAGLNESLSVSAQDSQPRGMAFNSNGSKVFMVGSLNEFVYEYSFNNVAPVIAGAVGNQAVNDNATINPFSSITITDANRDNVSATIYLDNYNKGLLRGTGLTITVPHTIASSSAASLQASLRALVFTPTENRVSLGSTETTTFTLVISDGLLSDSDNATKVVVSPVAPSVVLSSANPSPLNNPFTVTATFSEAVSGFVEGDFQVSNATVSGFNAVSSAEYSALLTPVTDGTVTVDVNANVAQDVSGINNTAATQLSVVVDTQNPTLSISTVTPAPVTDMFTVSFNISEDITGFISSDITITGGLLDNFTQVNPSLYTVDVYPLGNGTLTLDLAAGVMEDAAGNGNELAQFSIAADLGARLTDIGTISSNATFARQTGDNSSSGNSFSLKPGNDLLYSFSTDTEMSLRIDLNLAGAFTLPAGTIYLYDNDGNLLKQSTVSPAIGVNTETLGINNLPIGDYKLMVDTDAGDLGTFELEFRPLIANGSLSTTIGCSIPQTIFFTDQSVFPDTWSWSFGDGASSVAQNPIHTYATADDFTVTLTVTDTIANISHSITFPVVKISVPSSQFTASSVFSCGPSSVDFTDASTTSANSSITGWAWDFGDGATSTDQNPTHVYDQPGIYTVKLTVTDSNGCTSQRTRSNYIQVLGPSVQFETTSSSVIGGPGAITFRDQSASGSPIVSWLWDFGDGTSSTSQNPAHTYNTSGTFDVSLTVTDLDGCSRTLIKTNYVNTIPDAFDVSKAIFTGNEDRFTINSEAFPTTLAFNNSGTKMFVLGSDQRYIKEYTLSLAFDISTAVYDGNGESFLVAEETTGRSLSFSNDGTKMFVLGSKVNEYSLSSAFDVSTAVYAGDGEAFLVSAQETSPRSLAFNTDGTKMFVLGTAGDDINEYNLSTAFDVSTAVFAGDAERFSVSAQVIDPISLAFSTSGTKMFVLGLQSKEINEYTLSTPFDVSTAIYIGDGERLSVASEESIPMTLAFSNDGTKVFVLGPSGNREISEYSLAVPVITEAVANQPVNDNATISPFSNIIVTDPNGDNISATIVLDDNAKGVLAGAGLNGTGPYTLASTDATSLQAALRAIEFNPTDNRVAFGNTETTIFTLEISDGVRVDTDQNTSVVSSSVVPTVAISSTAANPTKGAFTATFTFSEAVTGFVIGDISLGNATASNFTATSASVYTALITPTTDGTVTIDVAANVAEDAATNGNTAATQFSVEADLTAPTVTISSTVADPTNGAFTATFTFSEDVTGFVVGDITLGNSTASNFTATSASVYTALITPTTDGTVTIDVAANVAQDAATNGNTAASQFSVEADLTAPTVTISSTVADPTNGAFTATFTFSEDVTGFVVGDISLGNSTASNFTATSASVYTALITPTTDGTVTIDVAANVAEDAATNGNTAASQFSVEADLTAPTVTISSSVGDPTNGAFTTTFTFSEDVTDFVIGDISLGNSTASNFTATSASVYTALITPTTDGTVTIDVAANVAQDAATNGNTAASQFSITADLTNPTVVISSTAADPINGAFTTTFTFSEAVTGFSIGDITLGNGTASNLASTSATVYTALITPTTDGTVTVDVAANVAQDAATNGNTAATQFSITADLTAPTVLISSTAANPINGAFTATFTFSEAVTGFAIGDITVGNGTASNFTATSASVYTADITPATDGTVTVDVAANVAQDAATNGNTAATQFSIKADYSTPALTIDSGVSDPTNGSFTATFTFSEAVTGFTMGDITVVNGTASNFTVTSASVYTALITPTTDGTVTIDVAANVAEDAATNGNTAATQFSVIADLTAPTVTITSAVADPTNNAFTATFTFSESVTGFVAGDIALGNATASNFTATSASVYSALITPTTDGTVTVDVAANIAQDAATNGNTVATRFNVVADFTAPEVNLSGIPSELNDFDPFTITYTFTEEVTGFASDDLQLVNAEVVGFNTADNINFQISFKAITNQGVKLILPINTLQDLAGNTNSLETSVDISFNSLPMDILLSKVSIDENNVLAAEIGLLTTADADVGDVQTYSLVMGIGSDDNDKFSITFDKLRAASIFDFETKSSYSIRVKTDDGKGGVFEKIFVISINDINEQPTGIALSNTLIEETDETSILVGLLTATDQDNGDTFSYELVAGNGDGNNDFFTVVNDELYTNQAINFEKHELLSIRVKVTDSGGLSFEKVFEIVISNVVDEDIRDFTKDSPDARIKNFFTPNGDGMNDFWVIEDIKDNPTNEVKVFTQSGKLVFSAKNYQNDWAGRFEGNVLPSGTYYYEINISNGESIIRGTLLILTK